MMHLFSLLVLKPPNTLLSLHYHLLGVSNVICTGSLIRPSSCHRGAELSYQIIKHAYVVTPFTITVHASPRQYLQQELHLFFKTKELLEILSSTLNMCFDTNERVAGTQNAARCSNWWCLGEGHVIWLSVCLQSYRNPWLGWTYWFCWGFVCVWGHVQPHPYCVCVGETKYGVRMSRDLPVEQELSRLVSRSGHQDWMAFDNNP